MAELDKKTQYNLEYAKKNLKRIPLDVQKEKYEEIATAAEKVGIPVNRYIKNAIDEKMERDGCMPAAACLEQSRRESNHCRKPAAVQIKDTSSVDLPRLLIDIMYQFDVRDAFGEEVLAELMEKAHNESMNQSNAEGKEN